MEKDHRLFLRNLPPDISEKELKNLFIDHGKIVNIDIKEKIQNDGSKIAFVNLLTTDGKLNTCFRSVKGATIREYSIHVEIAKESFLDRLKRERESAASAKTKTEKVAPKDQHIEKINIAVPKSMQIKPTKRIYNFDDVDNDDSMEKSKSNNASNFTYDPALQIEEEPPKKAFKIEIPSSKKVVSTPAPKISAPVERKVLSASEIKRLASLKEKRQNFKAQGQMIRHALQAVDNPKKNNKVIFSEDIDAATPIKKKKSLFNDDDENDDDQGDWADDKFQHDEKRHAKLTMSLNNVSRDKRFTIDDRFLDDDEVKERTTEQEEESELKNETKWQLDILQNVLGKPLKARQENLPGKKQNRMVRYDPTSISDKSHELEGPQKSVPKKKKSKATIEPTEEEKPLPVSSDVFYTVSENLADSLKPQEGFSLLKAFGTATQADKNRSEDYNTTAPPDKKWEQNFGGKNQFKYESSDDEGPEPTLDQLTRKHDAKTAGHAKNANDAFFFAINDQRFRDAEEFFKKGSGTQENFTNVRRELKQIVKAKIRNNVKKNSQWRNTKIARQPKVR